MWASTSVSTIQEKCNPYASSCVWKGPQEGDSTIQERLVLWLLTAELLFLFFFFLLFLFFFY